jgi:type IV pilus assembly protein PilP
VSRVRAVLGGLALGVAALVWAGCGSDAAPTAPPTTVGGQTAPPTPAAGGANPNAPGAVAAPSPTAGMPALPLKTFEERDFAETDQSRDPFRSFASSFISQVKTPTTVQRKTLVERYALDELKLNGIVSRGTARALLIDPSGLGWVAKVGDLVGKAELVHAGGPTGVDVAVNWRVDRIRPSDVVFVREDPSHPEIPPTTRVIALRTPEEEAGLVKK